MMNQRVATMTNKVKPYIAKSYIYTYLRVVYLFLGDVFISIQCRRCIYFYIKNIEPI